MIASSDGQGTLTITGLLGDEAVDDYLLTCKKAGRAPQKPYSGKIMLRVPPEIHARAAMLAEAHGKSLNSWVTDLLSNIG